MTRILAVAIALSAHAETVAPGVNVQAGPVNSVTIDREGSRLAIYGGTAKVERVLFTHHRRDVVSAGVGLVAQGAEAFAPAAEQQYFTGVTEFWEKYREGRFHDYQAQTRKVLAVPLAATFVKGGDTIDWRGLKFEVIDSTGFTPGSVTYFLETGGKKIAFTGDLIYGDGRLLDLYSLQDAVAGTKVRGYHGYAARSGAVIASLREVLARNPDILVPARGPAIRDPKAAVDRLAARLQAHFREYFASDALRWYWGDDNLRQRAKGVLGGSDIKWMEMAPRMPPGEPAWIVPIQTSRLLISESGSAILIDCGYQKVIDEVKRLRDEGKFRKLDFIYVTHYHDDHTDFAQKAAEEFGVPAVYSDRLRDIMERPGDFKMPAMTASGIRASEPWAEGQTRQWHEFQLTSYFFPGQTLYHGALMVEKKDAERIFFVGDSFTPSGLDDYCLWNRNLLGADQGYLYCLRKLKEMKPGFYLVNEHVEQPFRFSSEDLDFMTAALGRRIATLRQLTPFDAPNYAVDERWAGFFPYAPEARASVETELGVRITNHSPAAQEFKVTLRLPAGWTSRADSMKRRLDAGAEELFRFRVTPATPGLSIVTADVEFGGWKLLEWTEAMVDVKP